MNKHINKFINFIKINIPKVILISLFTIVLGSVAMGNDDLNHNEKSDTSKENEPFKLHTKADFVIYREQLPIAPSGNILEILQGRIAGLRVIQTNMNEFSAVIRGQGTPLYLWDGIPINESTLQSINQFDINRIEVLRGSGTAAIYGGQSRGGVIAFFSETGDI
jgi:outer membrane receptor protein involved in Fe transport